MDTLRNKEQEKTWAVSKIGLAAALLVVMTVGAYLPAVRAGFIWDDNDYVYDNQTLRSVDGLRQIWFKIKATPQYYPMVHTSYWLEYRFWKLNPAGYHIVNILLHAVGAVLLWRILTILHLPKPGAWLAAAIFALHPVHVESVAWITERKNVLSGVFYLGAALAYLHYALAPENKSSGDKSRRFYIVSLVLFMCALLSKTVTCSLPAALLLVLWWKRQHISWVNTRGLIPFFILGITFGLLTAWMEKQHVGAVGEEWNLSFIERGLVAGRVMWFYAGKLFWPANLIFIYPKWQIDTTVWWQYLFVIGAAAVLVIFWFLSRWLGRGALAAVLVYGLTLVPASGFFNIYWHRYTFVADHAQYIASIALITLTVAATIRVVSKFGSTAAKLSMIGAGIILMLMAGLTFKRTFAYENLEVLWKDTFSKNPDCWIASNNYGTLLHKQGRLEEALVYYRAALRANPKHWETHNNMGQLMLQMKQFEQAIRHFNEVPLTVPEGVTPSENDKSLISQVHYHLGVALSAQDEKDKAIRQFREALLIKPEHAKAHNHLGLTLQSQGKMDEAIKHYRQAITAEPNYTNAHMNLGFALQSQDKLSEALGHYRQVLESEPNSVVLLNNMAWILATHADSQIRNANQAITFAERAAKLTKHQNAQILDTLAAAYAAAGQFDQAVATAEAALNSAIAKQDEDLANHIRKLLQRYKQAKP